MTAILNYTCDANYDCSVGVQCPNNTCTLPSCAQQQGFFSNRLKKPLEGTSNTPFVRIAFVDYKTVVGNVNVPGNEIENIIITTGNTSSYFSKNNAKDCSAVITSFQYSWVARHGGNAAKITIMDTEGSSFIEWMKKIIKNVETATIAGKLVAGNLFQPTKIGVYKLKVNFGWILTGTNGFDCPTSIPYIQGTNARILCSPDIYFIPWDITVNYQNGKFIYELSCVDPFQASAGQRQQRVYGTDDNKISFRQAVTELGKSHTPRIAVAFFDANGTSGMTFSRYVGSSTTPIQSSQSNPNIWCPLEGPAGVWRCNGLDFMSTVSQWLAQGVLAVNPKNATDKGIGICMNYDPTYQCPTVGGQCFDIQTGVDNSCNPTTVNDPLQPPRGRLLFWPDVYNSNFENDEQLQARTLATYIVNGSNCSPVISFTPNIRWNFLATLASGGASTPQNAIQRPVIQVNAGSPAVQRGGNAATGGIGIVGMNPVMAGNQMNNGTGARGSIEAVAEHTRANMLLTPIDAELKVQGDPCGALCTPLLGYGKAVGLVVMNPFYLTDSMTQTNVTGTTTTVTTVPPYGTVSGCPGWSTLSASNCNNPLSNRNWFINGVEHHIKAGSYVTTYKLRLWLPGSDGPVVDTNALPNAIIGLGRDPNASTDYLDEGYQSTVACIDRVPDGADYIYTPSFQVVGTECESVVVT